MRAFYRFHLHDNDALYLHNRFHTKHCVRLIPENSRDHHLLERGNIDRWLIANMGPACTYAEDQRNWSTATDDGWHFRTQQLADAFAAQFADDRTPLVGAIVVPRLDLVHPLLLRDDFVAIRSGSAFNISRPTGAVGRWSRENKDVWHYRTSRLLPLPDSRTKGIRCPELYFERMSDVMMFKLALG